MKAVMRQYRFLLLMLSLLLLTWLVSPQSGRGAAVATLKSISDMLALLPPVFLLIGLIDVWVPKETILKQLGDGAGIWGILTVLFLGTLSAGPLYAAFPLAVILLEKGARPANVYFFLGVWSSAKLPVIMYETGVMGTTFTVLHLGISLTLYYFFSLLTERLAHSLQLQPEG
ncbi:MAG: permease [Geobacter sp.]|nr:permease [Geobacter sp.]